MANTRVAPILAFLCACGDAGQPQPESASGTTNVESTGGGEATGTTGEPTTGTTGAPEGALRMNHLQAMGTHNSYHVSSGTAVKAWDYTHRPLGEQLELQGVRKFELDIYFTGVGAPIAVYHIEALDPGTTCATLVDCLMALRAWSDAHPMHHFLYVMLEFKSPFDAADAAALFDTLDEQLLSVLPRERLVVPDDVQGTAATLRDGLAAGGWPTLDAARGKFLFVLHDGGKWREAYTPGGATTGRLLFPDAYGDLALPFAAVHSINDALADVARIHAAVDAGHLVRTRADSDNIEPSEGDYTRADAALASGAHFISTDYPPPKGDKYDYLFEIPDGNPSRCNPRVAPPDCSAQTIEDL